MNNVLVDSAPNSILETSDKVIIDPSLALLSGKFLKFSTSSYAFSSLIVKSISLDSIRPAGNSTFSFLKTDSTSCVVKSLAAKAKGSSQTLKESSLSPPSLTRPTPSTVEKVSVKYLSA